MLTDTDPELEPSREFTPGVNPCGCGQCHACDIFEACQTPWHGPTRTFGDDWKGPPDDQRNPNEEEVPW